MATSGDFYLAIDISQASRFGDVGTFVPGLSRAIRICPGAVVKTAR